MAPPGRGKRPPVRSSGGSRQVLLAAGLLAVLVGGATFYYFTRVRRGGKSAIDLSKTPEERFIHETLARHKVVVFSKSYCPFSQMAKDAVGGILKPNQFHVVELDHRQDMQGMQDALQQITGGRTVPRVFVDKQFIGGGDDTVRKAESGELKRLFKSKGVL